MCIEQSWQGKAHGKQSKHHCYYFLIQQLWEKEISVSTLLCVCYNPVIVPPWSLRVGAGWAGEGRKDLVT